MSIFDENPFPENTLEVGHDDQGEVVINHGNLQPDEKGIGHLVFSPEQARELATLLWKHAEEAEFLKWGKQHGEQ
jgi:hypothetical protein